MECKGNTKTYIDPESFHVRLVKFLVHYEYMFQTAKRLTANLRHHLRVIRYEDLLGDRDVVGELVQWFGLDIKYFKKVKSFSGKCHSNCTKNTSDDLRTVIENYEEVENLIKTNYSCLLPEFYETRADVIQPSLQTLCGGLFSSQVNWCLKKILEEVPDKRFSCW